MSQEACDNQVIVGKDGVLELCPGCPACESSPTRELDRLYAEVSIGVERFRRRFDPEGSWDVVEQGEAYSRYCEDLERAREQGRREAQRAAAGLPPLDWNREEFFRREIQPLMAQLYQACKRAEVNLVVLVETWRRGDVSQHYGSTYVNELAAGPYMRQLLGIVLAMKLKEKPGASQ